MRTILLLALIVVYSINCYSQTETQTKILIQFIEAHNTGSDKAIKSFIQSTYHPEVVKKIDVSKHVGFYKHIVNEFGALNPKIYKTIEATQHKLIVYLIKREELNTNVNIDERDILVVEIDISKDDPNYMPRGLGLGALVCEREKE